MNLANAIALIAIMGTRQNDGTLMIDGEPCDDFPKHVTVDGLTFDFAEEEEIDAKTKDCLGHYFRRTG